MKCSDVANLLVDFLYEEMPAEQRRDFLAHVDACASCSAEVKAMASTLGHARAALRGPLAEEPPPRLRAQILQAAAAAADKATTAAKPRRAPQTEGFFSRLWKTPWLVPALGAASVATVVLLVKVIKNPQVLPEPKPAAVEMRARPESQPAPAQPGRSEEEGETPSPSTRGLDQKAANELRGGDRGEIRRAAGARPRAAARSQSNLATSGRRLRETTDDLVGQADEAPAPAGQATTGKGGLGTVAPNKAHSAATAEKQAAPALHTHKAESSPVLNEVAPAPIGAVGAGAASPGRWAEPPPPRPAPTSAASGAAAPAPAKRLERAPAFENQLERASQEPDRSAAQAKAQAAETPPAAQTEARADKKKSVENRDSISLEERIRKAQKLFDEKKWAEAAAAFRALIAQAPSNPAAKTWRERVAAAEVAQEQTRIIRAKAVSQDPLDGL